jgi:transcriptional regulator with XRE-family HTH domain
MLSMVDELLSFVNWLNQVIREKNITQADIARTGFVTTGAVSKLFTMQVKSVGVDMCRAVAAATNIPLTIVMERAGILPASSELTPKKRELMERLKTASDEDVLLVIEILEASVRAKQRQVPASTNLKTAPR